jgi:hypothetical protein
VRLEVKSREGCRSGASPWIVSNLCRQIQASACSYNFITAGTTGDYYVFTGC